MQMNKATIAVTDVVIVIITVITTIIAVIIKSMVTISLGLCSIVPFVKNLKLLI